jgi:hypothetical protein
MRYSLSTFSIRPALTNMLSQTCGNLTRLPINGNTTLKRALQFLKARMLATQVIKAQ